MQKKEIIQIVAASFFILILASILIYSLMAQDQIRDLLTQKRNIPASEQELPAPPAIKRITSLEEDKPQESVPPQGLYGILLQEGQRYSVERDPFIPAGQKTPGTPKKKTEPLVLSGVLWDDANPQAMIGDQIFGEGDTIQGYKVIDIQKTKVILDNGTATLELNLGE